MTDFGSGMAGLFLRRLVASKVFGFLGMVMIFNCIVLRCME